MNKLYGIEYIKDFIAELGCLCNEYPKNKFLYNIYLISCKLVYYGN